MTTTTKQHKDFIEIENDLRELLNSKSRDKERTFKIVKVIGELPFKVSKQYLKGLMRESLTAKQKSNKVSYLLLNTNKEVLNQNAYLNQIRFKKLKLDIPVFSSSNFYYRKMNVGVIYRVRYKKSFDFLVFNPIEIKQIQQERYNMFLRSLNLFPEMVKGYFFNYVNSLTE